MGLLGSRQSCCFLRLGRQGLGARIPAQRAPRGGRGGAVGANEHQTGSDPSSQQVSLQQGACLENFRPRLWGPGSSFRLISGVSPGTRSSPPRQVHSCAWNCHRGSKSANIQPNPRFFLGGGMWDWRTRDWKVGVLPMGSRKGGSPAIYL